MEIIPPISILIIHLLITLHLFVTILFLSLSQKAHSSLNDGLDQAKALHEDHKRDKIVEDAKVGEHRDDLERRVKTLT